MAAPGNAYPAVQLDERGQVVDSGVVVQFTDSTDQPGSGGGGSSVVIEYTYAFDFTSSAALAAGATVYTPTIGQSLIDAWFEVDAPFDGTTPLADIGTFVGGGTGLFSLFGVAAVDMTQGDVAASENAGLQVSAVGTNDLLQNVISSWYSQLGTPPAVRTVPLKFTAMNPLQVAVSQDGTKGGAAIDSTQGAAVLHLIVSSPVVSPG